MTSENENPPKDGIDYIAGIEANMVTVLSWDPRNEGLAADEKRIEELREEMVLDLGRHLFRFYKEMLTQSYTKAGVSFEEKRIEYQAASSAARSIEEARARVHAFKQSSSDAPTP